MTKLIEVTQEDREALQRDCGIPHTPTPLTYELRRAVGGKGDRAYDWSDKPHRLLYDACGEVEKLSAAVRVMEAKLAEDDDIPTIAYLSGAYDARKAERAAIVAWLRTRGAADGADFLADLITAGEHLAKGGEG